LVSAPARSSSYPDQVSHVGDHRRRRRSSMPEIRGRQQNRLVSKRQDEFHRISYGRTNSAHVVRDPVSYSTVDGYARSSRAPSVGPDHLCSLLHQRVLLRRADTGWKGRSDTRNDQEGVVAYDESKLVSVDTCEFYQLFLRPPSSSSPLCKQCCSDLERVFVDGQPP